MSIRRQGRVGEKMAAVLILAILAEGCGNGTGEDPGESGNSPNGPSSSGGSTTPATRTSRSPPFMIT